MYLVVAIKQLTRWLGAQVLFEENSRSIMEFIMNNVLFRHGCPSRIQMDGGSPYVSKGIWKFYCIGTSNTWWLQHTIQRVMELRKGQSLALNQILLRFKRMANIVW